MLNVLRPRRLREDPRREVMRVCYRDGRPSKWIDEDNMTGKLTFTDDDLKRLKEYVERLRGLKVSTMATVDTSRLMLLIARLEAAEKGTSVLDDIQYCFQNVWALDRKKFE